MECTMNQQAIFQASEVELVYRSKVKASQRPKARSSKDCYKIFLQSWDSDKIELIEQFKVLLLNRAMKVLGIYEVSTGGITSTTVDPRLIFAAALKASATSIVLAHSHPSGSLKPSDADMKLTQRLKYGGEFLAIPILDHLIVSNEGYLSFADEGLL